MQKHDKFTITNLHVTEGDSQTHISGHVSERFLWTGLPGTDTIVESSVPKRLKLGKNCKRISEIDLNQNI